MTHDAFQIITRNVTGFINKPNKKVTAGLKLLPQRI